MKKMLLIFLILPSLLHAQPFTCNEIEAEIERLKKTDRAQLASKYKQLGDCYVAKGDKNSALVAYRKALSFPYQALLEKERLEIVESLHALGEQDFARAEEAKIQHQIPSSSISHSCRSIQKDIEQAIKNKHEGRLPYLYTQLGDCYARADEVDDAVKYYNLALAYPFEALHIPSRLHIANYLGNVEHYDASIVELDKILSREPHNMQAQQLLARFQLWKGEPKLAEASVDTVLKQEPTNIEAKLTKASIYAETKRESQAIALYQQLLANSELTQEQRFDARYGLSFAYFLSDRRDLAMKNLQFAEAVLPRQQRKKAQLEHQLTDIESIESSSKKVLCKNYLEKIHEAEKKKSIDKLARLYMKLGNCYANSQEREMAAISYEKAFTYPLNQLKLHQQLKMAKYLGYQDHYDRAIFELERIIRIEPKNEEALILIARFFSWRDQEHDQERAEYYIDKALAKEATNIEALIIKGHILAMTERAQEALFVFHKLLAKKFVLNPEETFWIRYGMALSYLELKEYLLAEMQLTLIEIEFPYQELKVVGLREKIILAKIEGPKAIFNEKIQVANRYFNSRCFNLGFFELYEVLRCDPCNQDARVILARGLGLMGCYCEALDELNFVLCQNPYHIDALIVKGMILRWKRDIPGSTCAFENAISLDEDNFGARIGLAWTDYVRGDWTNAYLLARGTHVTNPSEYREMEDLYWEVALGPNCGFEYFRYLDSDDIETHDYYGNIYGYYGDYRLEIEARHVDATQPVVLEEEIVDRERADAGYLNVVKYYNPCFDIGGGVGFANTSQGDFVLGNVRANIHTHCGNWFIGSDYDIYTYTAAGIFFEIRTWENLISYSQVLSGKWVVGGDYSYTYYTDGNHSNRVNLWAEYRLIDTRCWDLLVNYRFRYWDFKEQIISPFLIPGVFGGHGYFDPFDYIGNQVGLTFILETKRFDCIIHPYTAYVTYEEQGRHNGFYIAGDLDLLYHFTCKQSIGFGFEAGHYPLRGIKYNYTILSSQFNWEF